MTNYEKIKNMSIEDMAEMIDDMVNCCEYGCSYCASHVDGECIDPLMKSENGIKQWLENEVW